MSTATACCQQPQEAKSAHVAQQQDVSADVIAVSASGGVCQLTALTPTQECK